jgi:peptide-methionine (S)-S-oxide reductase
MGLFSTKSAIPTATDALPGRSTLMPVPDSHHLSGEPLQPPFAAHLQQAVFGMGCFWGAERRFWEAPGVVTTAAGYTGGMTPNPTYEEVCSGMTGHNEVVLVVFDPAIVTYTQLLTLFWESHNPTQGMRQGNDMGTQYRSGIYTYTPEQLAVAQASELAFQASLDAAGFNKITTEIAPVTDFYYAEHYHQQYLAKVPNGYCGLGGTGVCYAPTTTPDR